MIYSYVMLKADEETLMPYYKIGKSVDPWRRSRECEAKLLASFCRPENSEHELHRRFSHLRVRMPGWSGFTEWFFDDTGEIKAFLSEWACLNEGEPT